MTRQIAVGIAGGSGSGKTWFSRRLEEEFSGTATIVNQDWYYHDLSHLSPEEADSVNFDHPDAIEFDLLLRHFRSLKEGVAIIPPRYHYRTHTRYASERVLGPAPLLIIEGLFVLHYPELRNLLDIKIFIESESSLRLQRRLDRDRATRDYAEEDIRLSWERYATPMFEQYIAPSAKHADFQWNPMEDSAFETAFLADLRDRIASNGTQAH